MYLKAVLESDGIFMHVLWWDDNHVQFNLQEPGNEAQIKDFVKKYNVSFDMFSKIDVNGAAEHPLYTYLKSEQAGFVTK